MEHEIDFANGHLFCAQSQEGDDNNLCSTLSIFKKMGEYYESACVVTHWKQRTLNSGDFVQSEMKVKDAIWQIKEKWLERASFTLLGTRQHIQIYNVPYTFCLFTLPDFWRLNNGETIEFRFI